MFVGDSRKSMLVKIFRYTVCGWSDIAPNYVSYHFYGHFNHITPVIYPKPYS